MNRHPASLSKSPYNSRSFLHRARARFAISALALTAGTALVSSASAQNVEYDVINGQTNLTVASTYTTGGMAGTGAGGTATTAVPSVTSDVTFDNVTGVPTYGPAAFTIPTNVTFGSLNDLSTTAIAISNTGGAAASTLALGGTGNIGDSVPGSAAGDLLFVATGANLTINSGAVGTVTALGVVLGQTGNFNVAGTAAISSVVSGNFGFTKTGAGTLTLSGVNTYTGPTSITGGTLSVNGTGALGAVPAAFVANQLTLDGGILITTGNITLAANQGVTLGAGGGTINGAANNTTDTLNGIITGSGALTAITSNASARAVILNGANTFSGGVIVPGVSQISVGSNSGLGTGTLTFGTAGSALTPIFRLSTAGMNVPNAITVTAGGTRNIQNNVSGTTTLSGPITLAAGGGAVANPTLALGTVQGNGALVVTGGITGTGNVAFTNGINGRTGTSTTISGGAVNNVGTVSNTEVNNAGTNTISAVIGTNVIGVIQNSTKMSLVLSGANTYTSTTAVNAGTLLYNGSVGTTAVPAGAVTVATGGRLGGTGLLTVASATVDAGGTLAPGATTGATAGLFTLNTTTGLTLNGTLAIGITATGSSLLTTTGGLTLGAGSILTVTGTSGLAAYDLVNYAPGTLSGTFATLNIPTGYTVNYAGTDFGGTSIELTAVPEPSTTWMAGITCLGFMGFRFLRGRRQSRRETAVLA